MLNRKTKYGLRAVLDLAREAGHGPVLVSDLAERQRIPQKFLEAILLDLKRHGLLQSRKGKGGGYLLLGEPDRITVGQVIRVLEGPLALVPCVSQMAYAPCEDCIDEATCPVRLAMLEVREATSHILDNMTLAGLNAQTQASARRTARRTSRPARAAGPRR